MQIESVITPDVSPRKGRALVAISYNTTPSENRSVRVQFLAPHLLPHAAAVEAAHTLMLRAIAPAKKTKGRIDGHKIADCLRSDFPPRRFRTC